MSARPGEAWLAQLRARTDRAPLRPRLTLWWQEVRIGSVEAQVLPSLGLADVLHESADGWHVTGELTASLALIATALQRAGYVRSWRNEQLAVTDGQGAVLGSVERGVVRVLGIATHAVHLLGVSDDGRHWVQQRAWNKASDPGLWDTLVGGMVPVNETAESALERETWEEAGLRLREIAGLRHGGHITTRRPSAEVPAGYVVERLDWFDCVVPAGKVPQNQDGEVQQFALVTPHDLVTRLERDEFTLDAALMFMRRGL